MKEKDVSPDVIHSIKISANSENSIWYKPVDIQNTDILNNCQTYRFNHTTHNQNKITHTKKEKEITIRDKITKVCITCI